MKIFGVGAPELAITLVIIVLLGLIPAKIAQKKGYSFIGYWIFGIFLFIPALIVALVISDKKQVTYDPADELAKYRTLLDNGTITLDEFEKKKSELLSQ